MFKYFTNVLLQQYLVTKMPLKVFVNGEYLKIVDVDDLDDDMYGYGMQMSGESEPFDYREITQIMIGKNVFTLDQVNKAMEKPAAGDSKSGGSGKDATEKPEEPEKEADKEEGEEGKEGEEASNPFA
jgi:hypothetical protein